MNDPDKLVALAGASMALFLAWRSLRSRGLDGQKTLLYGVVWVILIAGVAQLFAHFGARA